MTTPTIASLHRSTQALCTHLCQKQTLTRGIAYYNPDLPRAAEANQFREVVIGGSDQRQTAVSTTRLVLELHPSIPRFQLIMPGRPRLPVAGDTALDRRVSAWP